MVYAPIMCLRGCSLCFSRSYGLLILFPLLSVMDIYN